MRGSVAKKIRKIAEQKTVGAPNKRIFIYKGTHQHQKGTTRQVYQEIKKDHRERRHP